MSKPICLAQTVAGVMICLLGFVTTSFTQQLPSAIFQSKKALVPNLLVEKSVDKLQADPGDTLTYTINFSNVLTDTAMEVLIIDQLPDGTIFKSELNPGWRIKTSLDSIFYDVGVLAPQDTGSVQLKLIISPEDSFSPGQHNLLNVVEIRGRYKSYFYGNKNSAITTLSLMPDIAVQKQHTPKYSGTMPGSPVNYQITIKNHGNNTARNVVILDTLTYLLWAVDAQPMFDSTYAVTTAPPDTVIKWIIPSIAPGDSVVIDLFTLLTSYDLLGLDRLPNSAYAVIDAEQDLSDNLARDTTYFIYGGEGGKPVTRDLSITKTDSRVTANPGDTLHYHINFVNSGDLFTRDITITEYFPDFVNYIGFSFVNSHQLNSYQLLTNRIEWYLNLLQPKETGEIILTFVVPDFMQLGTNMIIDSVTIGSSTLRESKYTNNQAIDSTRVAANRDLELKKFVDQDSSAPGEVLLYTLRLKNLGNMAADNVTLVDSLSGKDYFSDLFEISSGGQPVPDSSTITWSLGTIAAGGEVSVSFRVRIKEFSEYMEQAIWNYARVFSSDLESDYLNNRDSTVTIAIYQPELKLNISHEPSTVAAGETFTYQLLCRNIGTATAKSVVVNDTLPKYIHLTGDTVTCSSSITWSTVGMDSVIQFKLGDLPPKMQTAEQLLVHVKLDIYLPGGTTDLINHGTIIDESKQFSDHAEDILSVTDSLFSIAVYLLPISSDLPENSFYLGSEYKIEVRITKPVQLASLRIQFPEFSTVPDPIPIEEINPDFLYETLTARIPNEAGFGTMTVLADGTSIFGEPASASKSAVILRPPEEFILNHNLVNLANGELLQVRFTLSRPEHVKIKIYTVAGVLVRELYDEQLDVAGEDQINWDGKNDKGALVFSGVYLLHLKTPSFEQVKKVIIVR